MYLSILQSFFESQQGFWRNHADKTSNANISKSHNSIKNHQTRTRLGQFIKLEALYISILQSFIKIQSRVLKKLCAQNFQWKYSKSHNSVKNHQTGTGLGQCTTRHCTCQSYKVSSKSNKLEFWRFRADKLKLDRRTDVRTDG